jgi:hypothetical protein
MQRIQGFPMLEKYTVWVEDLGYGRYRVWHTVNSAGPKGRRYDECVSRDPVAATQAQREYLLQLHAFSEGRKPSPEALRKARVETYSAWAQLTMIALPALALLACCISLGPLTTITIVLMVLCVRMFA